MKRLAEMGCLICKRPAEIHHSKCFPGRDHRYVMPLCPEHHRFKGVHYHGNERKYLAQFGIDPEQWCKAQWKESEKILRTVPGRI